MGRTSLLREVEACPDPGIIVADDLKPTRHDISGKAVIQLDLNPRLRGHAGDDEVERDRQVVLPHVAHRELAVGLVHVHGSSPPRVEDLRTGLDDHGAAVHVDRRESLVLEHRRVERELGRVIDLEHELTDVDLAPRVRGDVDRDQLVHAVVQLGGVVVPLVLHLWDARVDDDLRGVVVPVDRDRLPVVAAPCHLRHELTRVTAVRSATLVERLGFGDVHHDHQAPRRVGWHHDVVECD